MSSKQCILEESRACTGCRECDKCDIRPDKLCNNCGVCIGMDKDFRAIEITEILWHQECPGENQPDPDTTATANPNPVKKPPAKIPAVRTLRRSSSKADRTHEK